MTWSYNGWLGPAEIELEDGVINQDAREVFSRGHCHSLALALQELLPSAELMGGWRNDELQHVYVRLSDGRALDINGITTDQWIEDWMGGGTFTDYLDPEDLEWHELIGYFRENRKDDALSFASALIEQEGIADDALALAA